MTNTEDLVKFSQLIKAVSNITIGKQLDENTVLFMYTALEEYNYQDVYNAVMQLVKKEKYLPAISDIINIITENDYPYEKLN